MGTSIGRIEQEFILSNLVDQSIPVELQIRKIYIKGVMLSVEDKKLVFSSSDSGITALKAGETGTFFFSFYSSTMTFSAKIIKEGNPLELYMTGDIYKNLKRKYVRVKPDRDISLTFILQNAKVILDFPKTQEYESFDSEVFSANFESSDIQSLIAEFKGKASKISSENKIVMFRSRIPETFEEKIITETGKCFFISDTAAGKLPDKKSRVAKISITSHYFLNRDGTEKPFLGKTLRQVDLDIRKKYGQGINAEMWCPVIYHEYVIGYVYLVNKKNRLVSFTEEDLSFCKDFCRVLAYVLDKQGYFDGKKKENNLFKPEIIDISAAGLLFTHSEKRLSELLGLYGDVKLSLKMGQRKLQILSRVMRKYEYKGQFFYGIQFLEIEPEDFRFLFDYVYGRSFTDDDDRLWEGGAPPPELDL